MGLGGGGVGGVGPARPRVASRLWARPRVRAPWGPRRDGGLLPPCSPAVLAGPPGHDVDGRVLMRHVRRACSAPCAQPSRPSDAPAVILFTSCRYSSFCSCCAMAAGWPRPRLPAPSRSVCADQVPDAALAALSSAPGPRGPHALGGASRRGVCLLPRCSARRFGRSCGVRVPHVRRGAAGCAGRGSIRRFLYVLTLLPPTPRSALNALAPPRPPSSPRTPQPWPSRCARPRSRAPPAAAWPWSARRRRCPSRCDRGPIAAQGRACEVRRAQGRRDWRLEVTFCNDRCRRDRSSRASSPSATACCSRSPGRRRSPSVACCCRPRPRRSPTRAPSCRSAT
jgi:hypothetical protein